MPKAAPKAAQTVSCKLCKETIPFKQFAQHRWDKHRAEQLKTSEKGREAAARVRHNAKGKGLGTGLNGSAAGSGAGSDGSGVSKGIKVAATLAEAQTVTIYPKSFTMSSSLVWQAREAAIRELNWPADITPEDFLDTWIYLSFKAQGILLGGYQLIGTDNGKQSSKVMQH